MVPLTVNSEGHRRIKNVSSLKDSDFHWIKSCNTDGIVVCWSKVEGSPVIAFKGEGIVEAPMDKVASAIIDTSRGTEWVDSLKESRVVRGISPNEFIEYERLGTPILMAGRDFVSRVVIDYEASDSRININYTSAEDPLVPPVEKYVRGEIFCHFRLVPMTLPDETYVEGMIYCDPKGTVPMWFVNFFRQGWPHTTFQNLRKQLKKSDIQVLPMVAEVMHKPAVKLVQSPGPETP